MYSPMLWNRFGNEWLLCINKIEWKGFHAVYVHCYGHRLNHLLVDSLKSVPQLVNTLSTIQALYNCIGNSNTRQGLSVNAQKYIIT